jgi:hypothetical protein
LIAGHVAHGLAWCSIFFLAPGIRDGATLPAIGWVHLVVLGWLTLTALSVLLHAVPAFTDNRWRGEGLARASLWIYALGVALLVASFFGNDVAMLPVSGAVLAGGLALYLVPAFVTLFAPPAAEATERAIARALGLTLAFLAATAGLGVALTTMLVREPEAAARLAPAHATLGLVGWLSLLIAGVSTRTLRAISCTTARMPALHIAVGSAGALGVLFLSGGILTGNAPLGEGGTALLVVAALLYDAQLVLTLKGASNPHLPPLAFVAASGTWLLVAVAFGLAGSELAFAFVFLMGWAGQMLIGHLHHIGIRVLATVMRGDDDETAPADLLDARLSWLSFCGFQAAVLCGAIGIVAGTSVTIEVAAALGSIAWCSMTANIFAAVRSSRAPVRSP